MYSFEIEASHTTSHLIVFGFLDGFQEPNALGMFVARSQVFGSLVREGFLVHVGVVLPQTLQTLQLKQGEGF